MPNVDSSYKSTFPTIYVDDCDDQNLGLILKKIFFNDGKKSCDWGWTYIDK